MSLALKSLQDIKWDLVDLPELVFFQEGPGVRKSQYTQDGIKLLNVANLQKGKVDLTTSERYISMEEAHGRYEHFLVDEGDLIIASSGIQISYLEEKMGFITKEHLPLCMNTSTIRFKSLNDEVLNIKYFMYFLKTNFFKKQIQRLITGSAQLNFGPSHLKQIKVMLPNLDIQNKIVDLLDTTQNMIDKRQQQIEALSDLKQSIFLDMFGDPLKKGIKTEKFEDVIIDLRYGTSTPPKFSDTGYKFIRATNIKVGQIIEEKMLFINEKEANKIEKCKLEFGELIFVRSGVNAGDNAIVTEGYVGHYGAYDIIVKPNYKRVNPYYLNTLFNSHYLNLVIKPLTRRAGQPHINAQQIKSLNLLVPSMDLQEQYEVKVQSIIQQINKLHESEIQLNNLYESILHKAFNGELFK